MACLLQREEFQYSKFQYRLKADNEQHVAREISRWDDPEGTAMFADALQWQTVLMATKMNFLTQDSVKIYLQG